MVRCILCKWHGEKDKLKQVNHREFVGFDKGMYREYLVDACPDCNGKILMW